MHFCLEIQGWPVHGTVMLLFAYSAFSIFAFLGGHHIRSGNSLQCATRVVWSVWPPTCKGESRWSVSCDLVPGASDYFENGHVIQFVPNMLNEQLAEAIWESSFLGLMGEVPSEFYCQSLRTSIAIQLLACGRRNYKESQIPGNLWDVGPEPGNLSTITPIRTWYHQLHESCITLYFCLFQLHFSGVRR